MVSRKRGFTLIELIVVITIIVVLIAILLPALGKAREAAKVAKCSVMLREEYKAFQAYATEWGGYMMPANCYYTKPGDTNKYGGSFYAHQLLGGYFGKGSMLAVENSTDAKKTYASLCRMWRCSSTDPSLCEFYNSDGSWGSQTVNINGETIAMTDIDHGSYTTNSNIGTRSGNNANPTWNPPMVKFSTSGGSNDLRKTTLITLESHGGGFKGGDDDLFGSVSDLLQWNSGPVKDGPGLNPLAGHPHGRQSVANEQANMASFGNASWKSNMLFADGQIILDNPYKMETTTAQWTAYNWIVNFRLFNQANYLQTNGFPF